MFSKYFQGATQLHSKLCSPNQPISNSCSCSNSSNSSRASANRACHTAQQRTAPCSTATHLRLPDETEMDAPVWIHSCSGLCRSQQLTPWLSQHAMSLTKACILRVCQSQPWHLHAATCPATLTRAAASALHPVPDPPTQPFLLSLTIERHPQIYFGC